MRAPFRTVLIHVGALGLAGVLCLRGQSASAGATHGRGESAGTLLLAQAVPYPPYATYPLVRPRPLPRRRAAVRPYRKAVRSPAARRPRTPRAGSTRIPAAARARRPGTTILRVKASVNLASELQALRKRHAAFAAKLPADLRRLDEEALPTLDQLPLLAPLSYLTTIEDYRSLSGSEQSRVREVLKAITALPPAERTRFIGAATKQFDALQSDPSLAGAARHKPYDTFFRLKENLDHVAPAPAAP